MSHVYLAFDLGAESGRALLGDFDGTTLSIKELHRFANEPVRTGRSMHWDVLRLWHEMRRGLCIAARESSRLDGIGVDTWGVDFALLDGAGELLGNPFHYRDTRTDGIPDQVFRIIPPEELYEATGVQFIQINTLFQVFAASRCQPEVLDAARHFVTIPDLLNYWLTGKVTCESTNASTTQMLDPRSQKWALDVLERLGIPTHFLHSVLPPGSSLGVVRPELASECGLESSEVIAPACHDTGSAVAAISSSKPSAFISSGTWSLMGAEVTSPVINEMARKLNFTNEGGVNGTIRLLKNITGMWLLQGCRKQWEQEGKQSDYETLVGLASKQPSLRSFINPNDPRFFHPPSMTGAIDSFCESTGQRKPSSAAEYVELIFESLALMYRSVLESLERLTGQRVEVVRVVGGGAKNKLLNQFTADATGRTVVAGPVEATALGNVAVQMVATGAVSSLQEARQVIDNSFPTETLQPSGDSRWDSAYERFKECCG